MNIRNVLYAIYGKLQKILVPTLRYSQYLYEDELNRHVTTETIWLDLGCGHRILPEWREAEEGKLVDRCRLIVGVDADLPSLKRHRSIKLTALGDIARLPFPDQSFDLVTANMVVEHLDNPEIQFREICRILKPGGNFVFHTVNAMGYYVMFARMTPEFLKKKLVRLFEGRLAEDVFPTHYRANSRKKIEALAQNVGFQRANVKLVVSSAKFIILPPLLIPELLWIRLLMTRMFKPLRTNIIAELRKA